MLRKLFLLAVLAMSISTVNAIDVPLPDCLPCPPSVSAR